MSPKKPYTFRIEVALLEGLKRLKDRDGIPESEAIRRALAEYLATRGVSGEQMARPRRGGRKRA